jgi:hypothetical protein
MFLSLDVQLEATMVFSLQIRNNPFPIVKYESERRILAHWLGSGSEDLSTNIEKGRLKPKYQAISQFIFIDGTLTYCNRTFSRTLKEHHHGTSKSVVI